MTDLTARKKWLALYLLCLGDLMIVLDSTIVNVALPSIRTDLGFSEASLAWVVNAYLLTFCCFLLLGGTLTDLLSWHWIFLVNIPVGIAVLALCRVLLPSDTPMRKGGLDIAGAITVTSSLMLAVYAIVNGNQRGWTSAQTLGMLGG